MKHYLETAENAARVAGELLRKNFQPQKHSVLRVNSVQAHDLKLEIDVSAQELIAKLLLEEFPGHALYGEEGVVGDDSHAFAAFRDVVNREAWLGLDRFDVQVVPFTMEHTNLSGAHIRDAVNLECDMVGKYVIRAAELAGLTIGGLRPGNLTH